MISLEIPSCEFSGSTHGELTVRLSQSELAESVIQSLDAKQLDDLLQDLMTNKGVDWMIGELTRQVIECYSEQMHDIKILFALIQSVRALARHQDDPNITDAMGIIRAIVGAK